MSLASTGVGSDLAREGTRPRGRRLLRSQPASHAGRLCGRTYHGSLVWTGRPVCVLCVVAGVCIEESVSEFSQSVNLRRPE